MSNEDKAREIKDDEVDCGCFDVPISVEFWNDDRMKGVEYSRKMSDVINDLLINAFNEKDLEIERLKAKIQTCKKGHKYLAESHEFPCVVCGDHLDDYVQQHQALNEKDKEIDEFKKALKTAHKIFGSESDKLGKIIADQGKEIERLKELIANASEILLKATEPNHISHTNSHIVDHAFILAIETAKKDKEIKRLKEIEKDEEGWLVQLDEAREEAYNSKQCVRVLEGALEEFKDRCKMYYLKIDGTYEFPNNREGDILRVIMGALNRK